MARQYEVGAGQSPRHRPISDRGVDLRGVSTRHWQLLELLAEYAVLDTGQVADVMFGSRPAAVRHLTVLVRAGLAWRFVFDNDPAHRAHYEVSTRGLQLLAARLHHTGSPVPVNLGREHRDQFEVNEFLLGLTRTARDSHGQAWLYGWQRGAELLAWLGRLGITGVQPRAAGVWLQDGRAVRFLLHVDDETPAPISGTPAPPPAHALRGYHRATGGIPASCLLLLCPTASRQQQLHDDPVADRLPVPIATTTRDLLTAVPDPSGPIWTVTAADAPVRLIDVPS